MFNKSGFKYKNIHQKRNSTSHNLMVTNECRADIYQLKSRNYPKYLPTPEEELRAQAIKFTLQHDDAIVELEEYSDKILNEISNLNNIKYNLFCQFENYTHSPEFEQKVEVQYQRLLNLKSFI